MSWSRHRQDCLRKQEERASRLAALPFNHRTPFTADERSILKLPVRCLVAGVQSRELDAIDVLRAYGKAAVKAHEQTNCLTEIMIAAAEQRLEEEGSAGLKGPLAGVPVSLKDTIIVGQFDTTVAYSSRSGKPYASDGAMVRLLRDAGAVPFVKTNIPITLLSFESSNDLWGRTTNPHNAAYSPGGSTGGEAALLALGGSRVGIGSDVAGSVRVPAHYSGCYALRCSVGRWPGSGVDSSTRGQEGVKSVFSPMAGSLDDLAYFAESVTGMSPWLYDHTVIPLRWRQDTALAYSQKETLRFGILRHDGVVPPTPACARALDIVVAALERAGHSVQAVSPPAPYEGLVLASQLLAADGCYTFGRPVRTGEALDPGAAQLRSYMRLPRVVKYLHYLWVRYARRDRVWAGLLRDWYPKSSAQQWRLVDQRETYRARWHSWWTGLGPDGPDVLLTVPHAAPALPHGATRHAFSSCGYTFLFNLLDYTAGVMPVTRVDRQLDSLPAAVDPWKLNAVARGVYRYYDADKMHGLPVGVQVVGRRLEEEKVLAVMKRIESVLAAQDKMYIGLEME